MAIEPHKIAIFLPSLRGGGAERVMVALANSFAKKGYPTQLVLVKAEGPYLEEVCEKVEIVDLNCRRVLGSLIPFFRYLRRERPSSVLSALYHTNLIAILARMLAGVKTRLVVSERNSITTLRRRRFILFLMRFLYPHASAVVAVSQGLEKELVDELGLSRGKVTAIPNPLDLDKIAVLSAERPSHAWLQSKSASVILAAGRLENQKDYFTLLEAFARVRQSEFARLIILGEGSLRPSLEKRIFDMPCKRDILLAGFHKNPFGWMAACDVYVLSSKHEGFPNSLIQAMACGARVVSTDCPTGPEEILEGGRWGALVPVGDAKALGDAIVKALRASGPHIAGVRAKDFEMGKIVERYEQILV